MNNFTCYLCGGTGAIQRQGHARDNAHLVPLECTTCGLVQLSSVSHIDDAFYSDGHMHDALPSDITPEMLLQRSEEDTRRRIEMFRKQITGRDLLDFGCGAGSFLLAGRSYAKTLCGVEPEKALVSYFEENDLEVYPSISDIPKTKYFDVITLFHVLEHIKDPIGMLREIRGHAARGATCIIEVPSADDALLTLYKNKNFSEFTYWSCHLYLFTEKTLRTCAEKAGLRARQFIQFQRYPLANHLYWLAEGKPGGQNVYSQFTDSQAETAYAECLARHKLCDTVIGIFTFE